MKKSIESWLSISTHNADSVIDVSFPEQYCIRMSSRNRNLEEQVKKLPLKDRARLALSLIESLDPGTDEDAEGLWLDEAEKRLKAYDAGKTESHPVNDVIAEIQSGLK